MDSSYVFNDLEPSFADLPMEIIVNIFRYLNYSDIQSCSLTCRRWLEASKYSEFQSNVMIRITKLCVSDKLPPAKVFLNSDRPFPHIYMDEATFGTLDHFFSHMGKTAQSVTFESTDITEKQFCAVLGDLCGINTLSIVRCMSLFMTGQFLESPTDRKTIADTMSRVRFLSLKFNQYLSDAILLRITQLITNLEMLDMSGCHIAYHCAIQRRFYPEELANHPSESILTFKFILFVIRAHQDSLKVLNFSNTLIGGGAMTALCEIPFLKLEKLLLHSCRQLNTSGIRGFITLQTNLRTLDLSDTLCVTDECLETIVDNLKFIEELNIKGCTKVTKEGALLLAKLCGSLKSLNISHCDGISGDAIGEGIARNPNPMLEKLYMSHLNICEDCVMKCGMNLYNLRVLDVSNCINGVTDQSVQVLLKNLVLLRELNMEECFRITDAALTGISVETQPSERPRSLSMEFFHHLPPDSVSEGGSLKISLRSKAEEEIVRDAERKKALLAVYELNLDESKISGVPIKNLKGLRKLNLRGCNKISDVSLKYGFIFLELRNLLLSNCQQISVVGMEAMVQNCPSIEELDLSDCYNINDKTIEVVTKHLKRLRSLHISGCTQLTDHSLDSIVVNCKVLHTLSVFRCRRMYSDIEERLINMSSVRVLNMDHSATMDNGDIFRLKKRLDY